MLPKEKTIFDELAEMEWITTQEIKTEDDARRIINAGKYEEQLQNLIQEALRYVGMHEIRNSTSADLLALVEIRKKDAETKPEPSPPPKRGSPGSTINRWLDWYTCMCLLDFECSLKQVAQMSRWSYSTIRKSHSQYKAEGKHLKVTI